MQDQAADRQLVQIVDATLAEAFRRAARWLACKPGCTDCCIGPFPITPMDAARLRRGLEELRRTDARRAARVRRRAEAEVALTAGDFPGDPTTGIFNDDDTAEEAFATRWETLPCPALDPGTGRCDLYPWRPISCRTFGPPVQIGAELLPPCKLCFVGASRAEIEACRVAFDPDGLEDRLLEEHPAEAAGTTVAFALAATR